MAEYVSRDDLLNVINSNVAEAHNERCSQLLEAILNAQTADVVEVVRCKDCEHYSLAMLKCCLPSDDKHSFYNYAPPIWQPNDFCSYGTPKERGGEK